MKLFPAKCHEQAALRKLWRQTGNSSLLPAKCWPLLHVIAGISAPFSNFAFVLFCYITNHLMIVPLGNSEFCFPRISMFPSTSSRETLRVSGNKIHCSPRDQSLSVKCKKNALVTNKCSTNTNKVPPRIIFLSVESRTSSPAIYMWVWMFIIETGVYVEEHVSRNSSAIHAWTFPAHMKSSAFW